MEHRRIASGSPWEARVGYSRAVRAGAHVAVSGTTGTDERGVVAGPDAYTQAKRALARIVDALREAGARPSDVVRTLIYVTDIEDWEDVARAPRRGIRCCSACHHRGMNGPQRAGSSAP